MPLVAKQEKVVIKEDGSVRLPEWLRTVGGFETGDQLQMWWLPPDQIVARRLPQRNVLDGDLRGFQEALRAAGYDSEEKIVQLVREVKREQAQEMMEKQGSA